MSKFEKKIGHYLKMNKSKEFFDNLINNENIKESIDNLFSKDNCSCKQIIEIYSSNSNNPSSTIINNNNNNINSKNVKIIDRIKKFDINEKIVLDSLLKIKEEATLTCQEIIEYKNEDNIIKRLFYSIERIVHKNLHCKKELNKSCKVLNKEENNDFKDDNNSNNYIEKIIEKKQKDNKEIEFIAIKTIIISMMNITTEMTCIYLQTLVKNTNNNNNDNSFDIKDFKTIHDEYVLVSNYCTTLENYFQKSFENFKNKYQINFTLSELFTDIFWNSLFHRKIFCESFINNYGNENISKSIQEDLNKIIKCLLLPNLSLKHQISELLEIKELTEKNEKYDLISLINIEKNKYQEQINLNKIKEDKKNNNNNNLFKSLSFTNNNNNLNNSSSDEDIISNKDFENFEIKEDKKETTITRILEYNSVEKFHDKKIIEKKEIYRCENIIENHIKKNKFIELLDEGNNKKENIFNTIDIINSSNDNVNNNNNEEEEFKIDSPEIKFIKAKEFTPNINELILQNKFNNKNNINKNNNKLNNNKSKKNKNNNDNLFKNFDNKTLDEIYNYIIDDNKNNNQNINKKKKNKKKKNKENNNDIFNISQNLNNNNNYNNDNDNNYNNNYNDNDNNYNNNNDDDNNDLDPIVEKFKSELNKIAINALDIQKIKPVISNQWIESIEKYY